MFLGNCGNYKGMGDAKFIPRCEEKVFAALAATSSEADKHYKATEGAIFSNNNSGIMHLGHLENGQMTTYYPDSKGLTKAEIQAVDEWIQAKKLLVVGLISSIITLDLLRQNELRYPVRTCPLVAPPSLMTGCKFGSSS